MNNLTENGNFFFFSAMAQSQLTATSISWVQAGIKACRTIPSYFFCIFSRDSFTMLARLVSNSWPRDLPTLASQSAEVTDVSHPAWYYFIFWEGASLCHPGWSAVVWSRLTATSTSWFQASSDSPASASQVAGIIGTRNHAQLSFAFLIETGFHHVSQDGLHILTS